MKKIDIFIGVRLRTGLDSGSTLNQGLLYFSLPLTVASIGFFFSQWLSEFAPVA